MSFGVCLSVASALALDGYLISYLMASKLDRGFILDLKERCEALEIGTEGDLRKSLQFFGKNCFLKLQ